VVTLLVGGGRHKKGASPVRVQGEEVTWLLLNGADDVKVLGFL
jgi:hypothetical protein